MTRTVQRMVTRARVVRTYYDLRECADAAAEQAKVTREAGQLARDTHRQLELLQDAEYHSGRHAGLVTALTFLDKVLADD